MRVQILSFFYSSFLHLQLRLQYVFYAVTVVQQFIFLCFIYFYILSRQHQRTKEKHKFSQHILWFFLFSFFFFFFPFFGFLSFTDLVICHFWGLNFKKCSSFLYLMFCVLLVMQPTRTVVMCKTTFDHRENTALGKRPCLISFGS